ncbi:hypothetical protein LTR56_000110 [Elasticomyces elasticus]|nr:hypothetical protein LTR56_000110 [Elasticomyces elasticus]KAK3667098.1 hypothetical protein LTR22_001962 [Elasticomyces elasticus]KAK4932873.1 hypothetical protein LTR49_000829 [Elasticomyces elasticus]KAK5768723.1 hypothetical protein LTS12_001149 [Elasticomyces elasticus]
MASAQEPPASNAEEPFRLLDLPDEIWARITRYAVTSDQRLTLRPKSSAQPPIARVCRLLREEALPTFYGNTIYYYDCYSWRDYHLINWLRSVPSWCKAYVSNTFIFLDDWLWECVVEQYEELLEDSGFGVVFGGYGEDYSVGRLRVVQQGQS